MRTAISLSLGLLLMGGAAHAQTAFVCPALPASTGLTWEHKPAGNAEFCRALRADGSEAFAVFVTDKAPFKPNRSDRAERGAIGGLEVTWYRSEIAGKPNVQSRETLVDLPDGRVAHVSFQASDASAMGTVMEQAGLMQFGASRLSSN